MTAPVAVEARGLQKSFAVPDAERGSVRDRLRPVRRGRVHEHVVLDRISFEVRRGEFFGVLGRNGSGKSTLLRILANVYAPDAGSVRVAGRVAPLIELGVGFDPELSARRNMTLNGVLMGIDPARLERRSDQILEFAEVSEFAETPLKHFSSGMRVRLAFAVAVLAETEILLVDEILAVGDASFQRRCMDVLDERRERGTTILFVSHAPSQVEEHCDRAMLLEGGRIEALGDPAFVGPRYTELLLESTASDVGRGGSEVEERPAELAELTVHGAGAAGEARGVVDIDEETIEITAVVTTKGRIERPALRLQLRHERGPMLLALPIERLGSQPLGGGERHLLRVRMENCLGPARYTLTCALVEPDRGGPRVVSNATSTSFLVAGSGQRRMGLIHVDLAASLESVAAVGEAR